MWSSHIDTSHMQVALAEFPKQIVVSKLIKSARQYRVNWMALAMLLVNCVSRYVSRWSTGWVSDQMSL